MSLHIIAAIGKNGELGKNNQLLWHLKEDLLFFKKMTYNQTIIMGRKTQESLPNKLSNRRYVVLTKSSLKDFITYSNISDLLAKEKEGFIIGGGEVYRSFLNHVDSMYLTEINKEYEADTFFPDFNKKDFHKTLLKEVYDEQEEVFYKRVLYHRKKQC